MATIVENATEILIFVESCNIWINNVKRYKQIIQDAVDIAAMGMKDEKSKEIVEHYNCFIEQLTESIKYAEVYRDFLKQRAELIIMYNSI